MYGAASDAPGMNKPAAEWRKLKQFQGTAQQQKIGGWGIRAGRLDVRAALQPGPSDDSFEAFFHPGSASRSTTAATRLDINSASFEALQNIPGVGNVLAKRIVDSRPYKSADELRRVKGIGAKKYEKLRPYFRMNARNATAHTSQSEVGAIMQMVAKHARDAFGSPEAIGGQWEELNFTAPPDFTRALKEYGRFLELLQHAGCEVTMLPKAEDTGLDSIYVRDAAVVCDRGVILCRMGKPLRAAEPKAQETTLRALGYPIIGAIQPPGKLEGGDVVWLDRRTVAVGRGYRTNDSGIVQLRAFLGDTIDTLITVPLPHWRGTEDVFHLMSIISPVDHDLAVVYPPLIPVPFWEELQARGTSLVKVPDAEFESMAANVLALAPRRCLMLAGNPVTRRRLEAVGVEILEYDGWKSAGRAAAAQPASPVHCGGKPESASLPKSSGTASTAALAREVRFFPS